MFTEFDKDILELDRHNFSYASQIRFAIDRIRRGHGVTKSFFIFMDWFFFRKMAIAVDKVPRKLQGLANSFDNATAKVALWFRSRHESDLQRVSRMMD